MEALEYLLEQSVKKSTIVERKVEVLSPKTQIVALPKMGAGSLILNKLGALKPHTYLHIDMDDLRIDPIELSNHLEAFCHKHGITTVAIEGYDTRIVLPQVPQMIITVTKPLLLPHFETLFLMPLDFEEFLALDSRYDTLENALAHFLQIGGFPEMIHVASHQRPKHLQNLCRLALNSLELKILTFVSRHIGSALSVFQIFERFKQEMKLSKDLFYSTFAHLVEIRWLLTLEKYDHPKAVKKLYLIDFAIKGALTFHKNFSKLFENLIFLELKKVGKTVYYDEMIDFYLPNEDRVVLALAFANEKMLFSMMEKIEGWLIGHGIKKLEVVTMNSEAVLGHPFITVEMIPFTRWALIES